MTNMKIEQKIPEGWNVKKLGEIANLERGKFSIRPRNDPSCYGGDFPFVQTGDITKANFYLKEFSQTLNNKGLSISKLFPENIILITIAANIGETAITTFPVCCPDSLIAISSKKSNLIWLNYIIQTHKEELNSLATQNAQKNINLETLRPLKILTPPLPEQKKIAGILSCWDDGIEKLSALIEKKKIQKKFLMQKLLTGKYRLQGFTEPWQEVKLGNNCKISTGESNREDSSLTGQYTFFDRSQEVRTSNRYLFDGEAIIIAGEGQNFIPKYFVGKFDLHQRSYCIMDFKSIYGKFLFFLLYLNKNYFLQQAVGSTVKSLRLPMFLKMKLFIPSDIAEQQAIAEILSKADEEIELLNKKLEFIKLEKKGLMQQLLTGKIRVKVN